MIETEADTRALFEQNDFARGVAVVGQSGELLGIFDQNFDNALDVNGRRTGLRIVNEDVDLFNLAVASVLIFDRNLSTEKKYTVRALEAGQRTTLLILEQITA